LDLAKGSAGSLIDKLLRLDISTMSALILFLIGLFLCLGAGSLMLKRVRLGSWQEFESRLFPDRLLPPKLAAISIRLGLIGTLLSFVMIAMMLFRDPGHRPGTERTLVNDVLSAGGSPNAESQISPSGPSANSSAPRELDAFVQGSTRTSFQVFLLLCASLYSSLVGCGAGYFVIPVVNRIGDVAAGRSQRQWSDPELARHEYAAQVERALGELSLLAERSAAVRMMTDDLDAYANGLKQTGQHLADVTAQMERTTQTAGGAAALPQAMAAAVERLQNVAESLAAMTQEYREHAADARAASADMRDAARSASESLAKSMDDLRTVTESMQKNAIEPSGQLVQAMGALVSGLRQSVHGIFRLLSRQRSLAEETAEAIAACVDPMRRATKQITDEAARLRKIARKAGARASRSGVRDDAAVRVQRPSPQEGPAQAEQCVDAAQALQTSLHIELIDSEGRNEATSRTVRRVARDVMEQAAAQGDCAQKRRSFWSRLFVLGRTRSGQQAGRSDV
jgi:hypothetical protein